MVCLIDFSMSCCSEYIVQFYELSTLHNLVKILYIFVRLLVLPYSIPPIPSWCDDSGPNTLQVYRIKRGVVGKDDYDTNVSGPNSDLLSRVVHLSRTSVVHEHHNLFTPAFIRTGVDIDRCWMARRSGIKT